MCCKDRCDVEVLCAERIHFAEKSKQNFEAQLVQTDELIEHVEEEMVVMEQGNRQERAETHERVEVLTDEITRLNLLLYENEKNDLGRETPGEHSSARSAFPDSSTSTLCPDSIYIPPESTRLVLIDHRLPPGFEFLSKPSTVARVVKGVRSSLNAFAGRAPHLKPKKLVSGTSLVSPFQRLRETGDQTPLGDHVNVPQKTLPHSLSFATIRTTNRISEDCWLSSSPKDKENTPTRSLHQRALSNSSTPTRSSPSTRPHNRSHSVILASPSDLSGILFAQQDVSLTDSHPDETDVPLAPTLLGAGKSSKFFGDAMNP